MATLSLRVVDLFQGDRATDFGQAAGSGVWGIIHKASTGATGWDRKYAERRPNALAAGLLWGAYHWGTHIEVKRQVDNFLKRADPDENTLVALDYEADAGSQMTLDQAREFLTRISEKLGRKAVLYSGHVAKDALGNRKDAFFGSHRLWLSQYGERPSVQKSWDSFWLWQYTDGKDGPDKPFPDAVPGLPGNSQGQLDCNSYLGAKDQLKREWAS
jgi:lysozyme